MSASPAPTRPAPTGRRPLVVTADEDLLDDVLRLAAAVGTEVEVAAEVSGGRTSWTAAPVVLLGSDVVGRCSADALSRG